MMSQRIFVSFVAAWALSSLSAEAVEGPHPEEISVREMGSGHLFVTADGMTLYTFKPDAEQPGTSTCVDDCAVLWPPVFAPSDAKATGEWTTASRPDGTQQWAYRGKPVYTYAKDTHPGAIIGEAAAGVWDVLYEPMATPPNVLIGASVMGQILTDLSGHTIYTGPEDSCTGSCLAPWLPVEAPWLARPVNSDWSIEQRTDGLRQWTYKEQPLFTFSGDFARDETRGLKADGNWQVVVLEDTPDLPDWVTFQETDLGPVMATQDQMTLYYLVTDWESIRTTTCDETCVAANWDPVIAPENGAFIGNWATQLTADGRPQWTYLGLPVFTFKGDRIPGDTNGDKFGTGSEIRGGWNAILRETLIQNFSS